MPNPRPIGPGHPTYIVAELSANHGGSLQQALDTIDAIAESGADAVKLQTYTPDTITLKSDRPEFQITEGPWAGRTLYDLYEEAHTPWDWHGPLFERAAELGLDCFSSPFDPTAVDFLEQFDPPFYKIASFELVDLPLIEYVASKGRPIIMSTGMATFEEIAEAVKVVDRSAIKRQIEGRLKEEGEEGRRRKSKAKRSNGRRRTTDNTEHPPNETEHQTN